MQTKRLYDLEIDWEQRGEGSEDLLDEVPTRFLEAGEILFHQGGDPEAFAVIRLGEVEVAKQNEDGSQSLLKILGPGEPVGLLAVVNEFPYPPNVRASTDVIYYHFTADQIEALQREAPGWMSDLVQQASSRVRDLADRLGSVSSRDVEGRLSRELWRLASEYGEEDEEGIVIDTRLTRQMLADMVGCTVESAIRQLSQWEKDGVISTQSARITLLEPERIRSRGGYR